MLRAVATSLGLALKSKDPGLELVDLVRSRKLLIILDSCEHVIETVALLAEQLYQETEQVYFLTTSRESRKLRASIVAGLGRITPSVEKWRLRTPPRYAALSPHAVTNFRG